MIQLRTSSPSNSTSPLVTVPDVAQHLSMCRSRVYQMMDSGRLPYVKLGRCRRILWTDVEALIAQNRIGPE
jgi:excisionase family DNA binding protein